MTRRPMPDPLRDLAGATPETLARALFRRTVPVRTTEPRTVEETPEDDDRRAGQSHDPSGCVLLAQQ